jgi:hypothetical protein
MELSWWKKDTGFLPMWKSSRRCYHFRYQRCSGSYSWPLTIYPLLLLLLPAATAEEREEVVHFVAASGPLLLGPPFERPRTQRILLRRRSLPVAAPIGVVLQKEPQLAGRERHRSSPPQEEAVAKGSSASEGRCDKASSFVVVVVQVPVQQRRRNQSNQKC